MKIKQILIVTTSLFIISIFNAEAELSRKDIGQLEKLATSDPVAQLNLGKMYYKGQGVIKNIDKAAEYLQKAADQGDEDAKKLLKKAASSG